MYIISLQIHFHFTKHTCRSSRYKFMRTQHHGTSVFAKKTAANVPIEKKCAILRLMYFNGKYS